MTLRQIVAAVIISLSIVAGTGFASWAHDSGLAPLSAGARDADRAALMAVSYQAASPGAIRVPRDAQRTVGLTGFETNTTPLTNVQALQAFKTQGNYHHISQIQPTPTPGVKKASLMHDKTPVYVMFNANTGQIMSETPQ